MTVDTVCLLGMVCLNINLEYYINGSGRVDIMASSTELPTTLFFDVSQLGVFNMLSSRPMTDQAGQTGMHFTFKFSEISG